MKPLTEMNHILPALFHLYCVIETPSRGGKDRKHFHKEGKIGFEYRRRLLNLIQWSFLVYGRSGSLQCFFRCSCNRFFPTMETAEVPANVDDPIEMLPVMVQLAEADPVSADSSN